MGTRIPGDLEKKKKRTNFIFIITGRRGSLVFFVLFLFLKFYTEIGLFRLE